MNYKLENFIQKSQFQVTIEIYFPCMHIKMEEKKKTFNKEMVLELKF